MQSLLLLSIFSIVGVISSCKKPTPFFDQINSGSGDANRKEVVGIIGGENELNVVALDVLPTLEDYALIELQRNPNNNAELTQPLTVKMVKNSTLMTDYNAANGTSFEELPLAAYSFTDNINDLTFAPGETKKDIIIHLKKDQLDLSKAYALGFTITEVGTGAVISATKSNGLYSIGVKNKYDGVYLLKGVHNRSPYNFPYEAEFEMRTSGASSVTYYWPDFGSIGHPIGTGPDPINDVSWYGSAIAPVLVFDLSTNLVTTVTNAGGTVPLVLYTGAGAPISRYDPSTKKIYAYFYYFTGAGQDFSNRGWSDTLSYIGPR